MNEHPDAEWIADMCRIVNENRAGLGYEPATTLRDVARDLFLRPQKPGLPELEDTFIRFDE